MAAGVSIDLIIREIEVGGPVAAYRVQHASTIVSGLSFATLLSLIVILSVDDATSHQTSSSRRRSRITSYGPKFLSYGVRKS